MDSSEESNSDIYQITFTLHSQCDYTVEQMKESVQDAICYEFRGFGCRLQDLIVVKQA